MNTKVTRRGGREPGVPNKPALDKIRANRHKLEKILLDKALTGDVHAIKVCLELLDDETAVEGDPEK